MPAWSGKDHLRRVARLWIVAPDGARPRGRGGYSPACEISTGSSPWTTRTGSCLLVRRRLGAAGLLFAGTSAATTSSSVWRDERRRLGLAAATSAGAVELGD